jgi:hypothetical protein
MNCHRFAQAGTIVGTQARWDHKAVYDLIWGSFAHDRRRVRCSNTRQYERCTTTGLSAKAGRRGSQGTQARGSADHTVQVRAPKPHWTSCILGHPICTILPRLRLIIPDIVSRTWPWRQPAKLAYLATHCPLDVRPACANRSHLSARPT